MFIACLDFSNGGHRLHLMRSMVKTILDAGHTAICITDGTEDIRKWIEEYCTETCQNVIYHNHRYIGPKRIKWNKYLNDILIALHHWRQYNAVLKEIEKTNRIKTDIVLIHYIDLFLSCLLPHFLQKLFFRYRWAGLYIHPRHMRMFKHLGVQNKKAGIRDIDYLFKSDKCIGIGIFDNGIVEALQFRLDKKVTLIPDISDVSTDNKSYLLVNEIKEKSEGRIIVGSIGISYYTGTVDLIKLALACGEHDFLFVFCGLFDEASYEYIPAEEDRELLRKFRKNPTSNCIWTEGYLKDEFEYNAVFNSLDIIFMMYPEHYSSSNRLTKAAYFNKLVLAANKHCVGENVVEYHLGETAEYGNTAQQLEKLSLLADNIREKRYPSEQWDNYVKLNNEQMLKVRLTEMITGD